MSGHDKSRLLDTIQHSIDTGAITVDDLRSLVAKNQFQASAQPTELAHPAHKRSATTIIINIAAILIAIAAVLFVYQIMMSALAQAITIIIIGLCAWAFRYASSSTDMSEINRALRGNLTGIGSALVVYGAYMAAYQLIDVAEHRSALTILTGSGIIIALFTLYNRIIKEPSLGAVASLALVTLPPALIHASVDAQSVSNDAWITIYTLVGASIIGAGYIAAYFYPEKFQTNVRKAFATTGIFCMLAVVYIGSYISEYASIWLLITPIALATLLYVSILKKRSDFLGLSAFFLVLYALRISFLLFTGLGISVALIMAALILVGIALGANYVNRTYIKT